MDNYYDGAKKLRQLFCSFEPFRSSLEALGANLIWFGMMIKLLEIGLITPPIGLSVLAVLVAFPSITLWLPRFLGFL